ncbi:MAG: hypothetical protein KF752_16015 [Pirellulaceae bacterium]|nr:hypothetical protein [Pirellulaceae bacterium]
MNCHAIGRTLYLTTLIACQWYVEGTAVRASTIVTKAYSGYDSLRIATSPDPAGDKVVDEMTVTVTTPGRPSPMDRHLELILYVGSYNGPSVAYHLPLLLPQGAAMVTKQFTFNQPNPASSWAYDVKESGRSISQVKPTKNYAGYQPARWWYHIDSTATTAHRKLVPLSQGKNSAAPFTGNSEQFYESTFPPADAADDWQVYLGYDCVYLSLSDLLSLADGKLQALTTYLLAGGRLLVYNVQSEQLAELDQRLTGKPSDTQLVARWSPIPNQLELDGSERVYGGGKLLALTSRPNLNDILMRQFASDSVVSSARAKDVDHRWFWSNLVRSVGKTPVLTFSAFVILFILLVGPGLLYLTHRLQQRTLMLVLVPALSGLLTGCVLVYNIVREGFTTYGRIASLQYYDIDSGQGFAWSRQSYFSGAPPREGLKFSSDAFLRPIVQNEFAASVSEPQHNVYAHIYPSDDQQILAGWMLPRAQQHLMVGHRLAHFTLPIRVEQLADNQISLHNTSTATLAAVLLRGQGDSYYWATNLAADQSLSMASQTASQLPDLMSRIDKLRPQPPIEIDLYSNNYRSNYWVYGGVSNDSDPLEQLLTGRPGLTKKLPEFSYFIITPASDNIQLPLDRSIYQTEDNFHVLTGAYRW